MFTLKIPRVWSSRENRGLYEITQTRHPGVLLAGVQQFKELDSGQNLSRQVSGREACRNDEGAI
jgi:hypothetical protein